MAVSTEKLKKVMHKVVSCFEESGELEFLSQIEKQPDADWEVARKNLEIYLLTKYRPRKANQPQHTHISHSKIPPLVLPSFKSINSSRYSAISREERTRGLSGLR